MKRLGTVVLVVAVIGLTAFFFRDQLTSLVFQPRNSSVEQGISKTDVAVTSDSTTQNLSAAESQIQVVAENLDIPWEIVFLPDHTLLVTERPGTLLRIYPDKQEQIEVKGVHHVGEGGLLGAALHPDFEKNHYLYLYFTTNTDGEVTNRVERYQFNPEDNSLGDQTVIIDGIPGATYHDGGRIAFSPDDYLYVTTGDAGNEENAQDTDSLAGKVLRLKEDGSVPAENPFNNPIYSYGHRNPQGLAWDERGRLWAAEHGPSGVKSGFDEINLIKQGQNYGWPRIQGASSQKDMMSPIIQSGANDTWAPAAIEIIGDTIFFAGLRGEALYTAEIEGEELHNLQAHFQQEYGRLRVVKQGWDGWLYIATSNTDGRGTPERDDDKIIRISSQVFGLEP